MGEESKVSRIEVLRRQKEELKGALKEIRKELNREKEGKVVDAKEFAEGRVATAQEYVGDKVISAKEFIGEKTDIVKEGVTTAEKDTMGGIETARVKGEGTRHSISERVAKRAEARNPMDVISNREGIISKISETLGLKQDRVMDTRAVTQDKNLTAAEATR